MPREADLADDLEPLRTPLAEIHPDPQNPNVHPMRSIEALKQSLSEHGMDQPIVARADGGQIIKGNGRYLAAKQLGWRDAAVLFVEDDELTALRRGLADHGTERLGFVEQEAMEDALRMVNAAKDPVAGMDEDVLQKLRDELDAADDDEHTDDVLSPYGGRDQRQLVLYFPAREYRASVMGRLKRARDEMGVEKNAELFRAIVDERESAREDDR